jgi:hypothetical protein
MFVRGHEVCEGQRGTQDMFATMDPGPWFSDRRRWLLRAVAFFLLLFFFAATLHPGVGGRVNHGDSAKFQFIGTVFGISHPPGNPLYVLLNGVAAHLPLAGPAWFRASMLSAAMGSLACVFLMEAMARLRGVWAALATGAALALGPVFWTLATEAEVYTLNAALLAATVYALVRWERERRERWLSFGVVMFILAFANHLTMAAALPALLLVALWIAAERHVSHRVPLYAIGAVLMVAACYGYVALRHDDAPYSEFSGALTRRAFYRYVTAKEFADSVTVPLAKTFLVKRAPLVVEFLQKQWLAPLWLAVGAGLAMLLRERPRLGVYLLFALAGFALFAVIYEIPDPEGFFVPLVCLAAFPLGFCVPRRGKGAAFALGLIGLCLAPPAAVHLEAWRDLAGNDMVEDLGAGPVLWDLPDVVARVPEGATFVLPCDHYGCIQTFNYFRFADETAKRRHVTFAELDGGKHYKWSSGPPRVPPSDATKRVVCSLADSDAEIMRAAGAQVTTIERPQKKAGYRYYPGVPIHCSVP